MKKLLLFTTAFLLCIRSNAQETKAKDEQKSKIEVSLSQSNVLFQKEFIPVGGVRISEKYKPIVKCEILKITNLQTKSTISGLRFEYEHGYQTTITNTAYLDADELADLNNAITVMQKSFFETKPANYTEVVFTSRSGFQAGAYVNEKGEWETWIKLERYDSGSRVGLTQFSFTDLQTLLESVKGKI